MCEVIDWSSKFVQVLIVKKGMWNWGCEPSKMVGVETRD